MSVSVITIDGPAGSGKGTIAHKVASTLGWSLLDSGALYRLVAFDAINKGVVLNDDAALAVLASQLDVQFVASDNGKTEILLQGNKVTLDIRTEDCGCAASEVAACPSVRAALLQRQRDFLQSPGLVADGRDMGTVVFADAFVKIYLTASAQVRAERRQKQLKEQGVDVKIGGLVRDIESRDARDSGRKDSPLKPAADALIIDTDQMDINAVVSKVLSLVDSRSNLEK
ncbi:MAG: (d)CMP kinase [Thiotrichaceae bacterium]